MTVDVAFLHGALMMGYLGAAFHFWRFWKVSHDRFFLPFAIAFFLLGVNNVGFVLLVTEDESRVELYVVRLAAYLLIAGAIVAKNVRRA
jgi:hypothetical protein